MTPAWARLRVAAQLGGRVQRKRAVALKLDQQHGRRVVAAHGLCLVVQPPRREGLAQVSQRLALHAHLRRQDVVAHLACGGEGGVRHAVRSSAVA